MYEIGPLSHGNNACHIRLWYELNKVMSGEESDAHVLFLFPQETQGLAHKVTFTTW